MSKDLPDPRRNSEQATNEDVVDRTDEFQKLSTGNPETQAAELAFLRSKLAMANTDPNLNNRDRARIIGQLRDRMDALDKK